MEGLSQRKLLYVQQKLRETHDTFGPPHTYKTNNVKINHLFCAAVEFPIINSTWVPKIYRYVTAKEPDKSKENTHFHLGCDCPVPGLERNFFGFLCLGRCMCRRLIPAQTILMFMVFLAVVFRYYSRQRLMQKWQLWFGESHSQWEDNKQFLLSILLCHFLSVALSAHYSVTPVRHRGPHL